MNKIFTLLSLLTVMSAYAQNNPSNTGRFILTGKITGAHKKFIRLYFTDGEGNKRNDSSLVEEGAFVFTGLVNEPTEAYLYQDRNNSATIFLEPDTMTVALVTGNFDDAIITGSRTQDEQNVLNRLLQPVKVDMKPLKQAYDKANEAYIKAIQDKLPDAVQDSMKEKAAAMHNDFEPFYDRMAAISYSFFAQHPQSYVTATNLRVYVGGLSLDSLQLFYDRLGSVIQRGATGKALAKEISELRAGSPGSMAADFTATDIKGIPLHLSDFRGKYVLLDFWASWCVPCRHGNPHLIGVYRKYHADGFDIIGVSDDNYSPSAWKVAVEKDSIGIWHHVLRGYDSKLNSAGKENPADISGKYGIHSLPTKILIDRDGKIVGRFDSDKEPLDVQLAKIFGR
ncbi:AhpC/TSA family protein [Flavitalea flava]